MNVRGARVFYKYLSSFILLFFVLISLSCTGLNKNRNNTNNALSDYPVFKSALYSAISGDVSEALNAVSYTPMQNLTSLEVALANQYLDRFGVSKNPNDVDFKKLYVKNNILLSIQNIFHQYWKMYLLKYKDTEYFKTSKDLHNWLYKGLYFVSKKNGYQYLENNKKWPHLIRFIKLELLKDGYFSHINYVKPLMNLMVWKKQYTKTFLVNFIHNQNKSIEVIFMDKFVEMGWGGYATFNIMHISGWATKKHLYAVKSAYDQNSEDFLVSYLSHELQHKNDLNKNPGLTTVELEYRAKLSELIYADRTFYKVLNKFFEEKKLVINTPHSYASYLLLKDIFKSLNLTEDINELVKIDKRRIKQIARSLLKRKATKLVRNSLVK